MRFRLRGATAASQSAGQDVTARIRQERATRGPVEEARENFIFPGRGDDSFHHLKNTFFPHPAY